MENDIAEIHVLANGYIGGFDIEISQLKEGEIVQTTKHAESLSEVVLELKRLSE